jgi:hypothetical protein
MDQEMRGNPKLKMRVVTPTRIVDPLLPAATAIKSMKVSFFLGPSGGGRFGEDEIKFVVPNRHFKPIIDTLMSAEMVTNVAKIPGHGGIYLEKKDGSRVVLQLLSRGGYNAALIVHVSDAETIHDRLTRRGYFRGGPLPRVDAALRAAFEASESQSADQ